MKERKATHITRKNYYLTPAEKSRIREYIQKNPNLTQPQIAEHFGISRGTVSNIKLDKTADVYNHPVYKALKEKLRQNEKQIFNDRNTINQMANRIHNLELRILSLNRQLEDA